MLTSSYENLPQNSHLIIKVQNWERFSGSSSPHTTNNITRLVSKLLSSCDLFPVCPGASSAWEKLLVSTRMMLTCHFVKGQSNVCGHPMHHPSVAGQTKRKEGKLWFQDWNRGRLLSTTGPTCSEIPCNATQLYSQLLEPRLKANFSINIYLYLSSNMEKE